MREGIHPEYKEATFICSCGSTFKTRSTKPEVHLELCSQCHPFYTGKQKFVDTGGRVQRFEDKFGGAAKAVMDRQAAEKDARRKAAEEAAVKAKAERDAREADRAAKAAKFETAEAVKSGTAKAEVVEAAVEAADEAVEDAVTEAGIEPDAEPAVEETSE